MHAAHKLDGIQIENVIDKLVPLIANEEDHEFFREVLAIYAEECSSGHFAHFVSTLLREGGAA